MKFSKIITLIFTASLLLNMQCDEDDEPMVSLCDSTTTIDSDRYQNAQTDFYTFVNAVIADDCLNIEISASGCSGDSWVLELVDSNSVLESLPVQRNLKLILTNNEACLAVFTKAQSFDLSQLRIDGEDEVILNVEGLPEALIYSY